MNAPIADRLSKVFAETAVEVEGLRFVPLVGPSIEHPTYSVLDAEALKKVRITEVSAGGSVPTLKVVNHLDTRLFLMDGQELRGAKQNRILNTSIMVPAGAEMTIPVSCVEQGRWSYASRAFMPGATASHRVRSGKLERVKTSLRTAACYDAGQSQVWADVAQMLEETHSFSPTMAMAAPYTRRREELAQIKAMLRLPAESVGLAVFMDGKPVGVDLFDRHATLRFFVESLVDSYAIEWLGRPERARTPAEPSGAEGKTIESLLREAAAGTWQTFKPPGEGEDLRLDHPNWNGAALVVEGSAIHLQLLPRQAGSSAQPGVRRSWFERP